MGIGATMKTVLLFLIVTTLAFAVQQKPSEQWKKVFGSADAYWFKEAPTPLDEIELKKLGYQLCEVPKDSNKWTATKSKKDCEKLQSPVNK